MKKILALAGSNASQSIHKTLVSYASQLLQSKVDVMDIREFDDVPLFNPDRQQAEGAPLKIQHFYNQLQQYDAFIIASPEYNGSLPAAFKNLIDWLSRINMKFLGQKPVLLMSTSPGPNGGRTNLQQLAQLMPWWGAQVIGTYSLGQFHEHFQNGRLSAEEQARLQDLLHQLEDQLQTVQVA